MIDIQVRVHDRFSVEFKIGYVVKKELTANEFMMNTWIFVPNSLDINSSTYSKNQFYRDIRSNIRLITPIFPLDAVADALALPFMFLQGAFRELAAEPTKENLSDYEYQIKMFSSIVKSSLRKETNRIIYASGGTDRVKLVEQYVSNIEKIISGYRELRKLIDLDSFSQQPLSYFLFGDEFLSNITDFHSYRLLDKLKRKAPECYGKLELLVMTQIRKEREYKTSQGYFTIDRDSPDKNRSAVFRFRLLKKYVESNLFLNAYKTKDGRLAEQVYFSLAAGLSMIFATAIAFSFQQKYGNFTMPFFVALVVSYMLKDRIKELTRFYFVHRLAKKYFDNKTVISVKENPIGWLKEGVDFITEEKVPDEVMEIRGRSDLLEADNRHTEEKIILYRVLVNIDGTALDASNQYDVSGINNILRYNVSNFIQKMDNPEVPLPIPTEDGGFEVINGEKIYYINFLMQFQYDGNTNYKRFRIVMSRSGIEGIEQFM